MRVLSRTDEDRDSSQVSCDPLDEPCLREDADGDAKSFTSFRRSVAATGKGDDRRKEEKKDRCQRIMTDRRGGFRNPGR
jgi:hypothetical protein